MASETLASAPVKKKFLAGVFFLNIPRESGVITGMNMKIVVGLMALLMAAGLKADPLPIGTVLTAQRGPGNLINLPNGVVTVITSVPGLDAGWWLVWGACTVQDTVQQDTNIGGPFLYTYTAISERPHQMPGGGLQYVDARPLATYWFGANPPPRLIHLTNDPQIFLIAESYGQVPPTSSKAWGSIIARKESF